MSFCGQCGFQLAPDDTRCSRCGAIVEPEGIPSPLPTTAYSPNDATTQSPSYLTGGKSQNGSYATQTPPASTNQQKLVLSANPYDIPAANEATSMMNAPFYQGTPPSTHASSSGYPVEYTPQQPAYPVYEESPGYPNQYPPTQTIRRKSPRTAGLVFILLGILLILGALVLFALQHNGILGGNTSSTITNTPAPTTPIEQAQAVVQHYYTSVNNHDYTTAYNLWKNNAQKLSDFKNGYRYTKHTDVTFGTAQTRTDGKIYLPVTITATEIIASTNTTRESVYKGYYLVEKQSNGTWLIFDGNLTATHA
jgi:hypothetical protein